MVEVTETALKQLKEYFADKEVAPIRVYLGGGCCSGPRLSLALDENRDGDESFENEGFTFLVQKDLLAQTGNIRIDMTGYGFSVDSENPVEGGGGSCSSGSCSSGGCGSGGCGC